MNERSRLGITESKVGALSSHISSSEELRTFVKGVYRKLEVEQPILGSFLAETIRTAGISSPAFIVASAMSYEMVEESERLSPLSESQLSVVKGTLREYIEGDASGDNVIVDFSWFLDKLANDSPSYSKWLDEMLERRDAESKRDFFLGAVLTTMPFFMRADAQLIDEELFGN